MQSECLKRSLWQRKRASATDRQIDSHPGDDGAHNLRNFHMPFSLPYAAVVVVVGNRSAKVHCCCCNCPINALITD